MTRKRPARPNTKGNSSNDVGYGRPPVATQFQPGVSGNPKGRPRGRKNNATLVRDELNAMQEVVVDGVRKKMRRAAIIVRRVVDGAVKGDPKYLKFVLPWIELPAPVELQPKKVQSKVIVEFVEPTNEEYRRRKELAERRRSSPSKE